MELGKLQEQCYNFIINHKALASKNFYEKRGNEMENMVDFGLQLYSINDFTKVDMEYAFKRIQEFYYKYVAI